MYSGFGVWIWKIFKDTPDTCDLLEKQHGSYSARWLPVTESSAPACSQSASPTCLAFSYAVLFVFSMTIRLESNERERLFADCQLLCFHYFKVTNHPVSGAQEACLCGGLFVSLSLLRPGFEGRRTGYTPWVDTGYVNLCIHPPRSGPCVSGCQLMVTLSSGSTGQYLEVFLVVTLGGWEETTSISGGGQTHWKTASVPRTPPENKTLQPQTSITQETLVDIYVHVYLCISQSDTSLDESCKHFSLSLSPPTQ